MPITSTKYLGKCLIEEFGKESTCNAEDLVRPLGGEDPLEEGMASHSGVLAWRSSWTEEPGGLQSTELQRVSHD